MAGSQVRVQTVGVITNQEGTITVALTPEVPVRVTTVVVMAKGMQRTRVVPTRVQGVTIIQCITPTKDMLARYSKTGVSIRL